MGDSIAGLFVLVVMGMLYFLPSLIAVFRHKRNTGAIFLLNLLLGWTVLGWVGALFWSALHEERREGAEQFTVNADGRKLPWRKR